MSIYNSNETDVEEKYGLFVKRLSENHPDWREYTLAYDIYEAQFYFYMRIYNKRGYKLDGQKRHYFASDSLFLDVFRNEQKVVVFQPKIDSLLQLRYELDWIFTYDEYKMYRIKGTKSRTTNFPK